MKERNMGYNNTIYILDIFSKTYIYIYKYNILDAISIFLSFDEVINKY